MTAQEEGLETSTQAHAYQLNLEEKIVRHCAPTLAGLKPANLFVCRDESVATLRGRHSNAPANLSAKQYRAAFGQALRSCRSKLAPHGVRIAVLARLRTGIMVYVYRPFMLRECLYQPHVEAFLTESGYNLSRLSSCIALLAQRVRRANGNGGGPCSFPHEVGLFLGYPYEDVIGFIENEGRDFVCSGCWKVYGCKEEAETCFQRYKSCTAAFEFLYNQGMPIERLALSEDSEIIKSFVA